VTAASGTDDRHASATAAQRTEKQGQKLVVIRRRN
jgi:hypothetical protein